MNSLAIIIPAYKAEFLNETLKSIAAQTCKNFRVYIGDDASPYNIKDIVDSYDDQFPLTYVRFSENIGGKSLIAQWQRCIDLSTEELVWLFSDDDLMSPSCVEEFYDYLEISEDEDIFRFNVSIIDKDQKTIKKSVDLGERIKANKFLLGKIGGRLSSFAVEYIFKRESFIRIGGFVNFDLAWNSDDATWAMLGRRRGIVTIKGGEVYWRASELNISRTVNDIVIAERKLNSDVFFSKWMLVFLKTDFINEIIYKQRVFLWFYLRLNLFRELLGEVKYRSILRRFHTETVGKIWVLPMYIYYHIIKHKVK